MVTLVIKTLPESERVICPWCDKDSSLKEWDDTTFSECISREQKRAFKHLTDPRVWKSTSESFFKCPLCGQWVRGNKLRLKNWTPDYKGLGGRPLFEVNGHKFDFNP